MSREKQLKIMNVIPYLVLLIMALAVIVLKRNYMVDEIYSYGLANHTEGIRIQLHDGLTYSPGDTPYMEYMTVQKDGRFNYANVWLNQSNDVHPPLYYAILHTICSVFPETFSRFYAGGINLVFAFITLYALRQCVRCFTLKQWPLFAMSLMFAISPGILNNISFFRMYVMAMCFVTLTFLIFLKKYDRYQDSENKPDLGFYISLCLCAFAGALTHYYCIIFTVLISAVFAVWLLWTKRYGAAGGLALSGAVSASAAWLAFPAMIEHMFHGYRGTQSMDNLKLSWKETLQRLNEFFTKTDAQLFGNLAVWLLAALLAGLILYMLAGGKKNSAGFMKQNLFRFALLWIPCVLYFIFVGKSAAYTSDRYMFPVYALLLTGVILPLILMADRLKPAVSMSIGALVLTGISAMAYVRCPWPYLYTESNALLKAAESHAQTDCLYIYDINWKTQPSFEEIRRYERVTFIEMDNLALLDEYEPQSTNDLIVKITKDDEKILERIRQRFPHLTHAESEGFYGYSSSWYLYGD